MTETTSVSNREFQIKRLRIILLIAGAVIFLFALLSDTLGLSTGGTIGTGQILIAGTGIIIILLGALGKHVVTAYRLTAFLLLNTVILFLAIEIIAAAAEWFTSWQRSRELRAPALAQETYQEADWADQYWQEQAIVSRRYEPFTLWRLREFHGATINISEEGLRNTPGANCSEDAFTIFFMGGSTAWGTGSPDWLTIPAFLQKRFDELRDDNVCVMNFGEGGYVVTQEIIDLVLQLQRGNIPDLVVFYDGANDIFAAFQNQAPYLHQNIWEIADLFESDKVANAQTFTHYLLQTNLGQLLSGLIQQPSRRDNAGIGGDVQATDSRALNTEEMAAAIVNSYINSYKIVEGIAAVYEFDFHFFWQPVIFATEKPLTQPEQKIFETQFAGVKTLTETAYKQIQSIANQYEKLHYIANVFDGLAETIYIDFVHINPDGNELVANAIFDIVSSSHQNQISDIAPEHSEE